MKTVMDSPATDTARVTRLWGIPGKSAFWPRDVAGIVGVSERQVRNWIVDGSLAVMDVSRMANATAPEAARKHYRIPREALIEFLRGRMTA